MAGDPVVALESSLVAHGLPHPSNLETARASEWRVRHAGAVPATTAIMDGFIKVGLTQEELERLGEPGVAKASTGDLGALIAAGLTAGTTVAATMVCARLAGIKVMATGGIGGVHHNSGSARDISTDIQELARTPVAVVCAGVKSVVDVPATLELLETEGVPVLGYRTDELPGFLSRTSGLPVPHRIDSPSAAAAAISAHWSIGVSTGILITNPPPEDLAIDADLLDRLLVEAQGDAGRARIARKLLTPFLLDRLVQLSSGATLIANVALIESNALLAGQIAVALAAL